MKNLKQYYIYGMCLAILSGCDNGKNDDQTQTGKKDISIALTRAGDYNDMDGIPATEIEPAGAPALVAWQLREMNDIGNGTTPYFVEQLQATAQIPDYTPDGNPYVITDVNKQYPLDNSWISIAGYAPQLLVPTADYSELYIPTDYPRYPAGSIIDKGQDQLNIAGRTDVIAAPTISGSYYDNITSLTPLMFKHKQSAVIFRAIRSNQMKYSYYVNNVRIRVPYYSKRQRQGQLVEKMVWDNVSSGYVPFPFDEAYMNKLESDGVSGSIANNYPGYYYFGQMNREMADDYFLQNIEDENDVIDEKNDVFRTIGTLFLQPGLSKIDLTISAHIAEPQYEYDLYDNHEKYHKEFTKTIYFMDKNGKSLTLKEGEWYMVTIIFTNDAISVAGYYIDWESGGNIMLIEVVVD